LAKDRPAATALTTYYCWIGIGGLGGGLFTLLIAPWIFRSDFREFAFLAALAGVLRPAWFAHGLADWALCRICFRGKSTPWSGRVAIIFDVGLPCIVAALALTLFFFRTPTEAPHLQPDLFDNPVQKFSDVSLVFAVLAAAILFLRPLRFSLALAAIMALSFLGADGNTNVIVSGRNAFGTYQVTEETLRLEENGVRPEKTPLVTQRKLLQGTMMRGSVITDPSDFSRYPIGNYDRAGPVGQIMRRLEWSRTDAAKMNDNPEFWLAENRRQEQGDVRLAALLLGLGVSPLGGPMAQATAAWSEPPYAFVGLGAGSLYSFARPFQWVDAYELDPDIVALSAHEPVVFPCFQVARKRGVSGKIFSGDARRNLTKPGREGFYHALFIDAINSKAIPTHLVTVEAIELYFQKLAPEGVVCIHTSNRQVNLPLDTVAQRLNLSTYTFKADAKVGGAGLVSETWVALARNDLAMRKWVESAGGVVPREGFAVRFVPRFEWPWTDEHSSVLSGAGGGWPRLIYGILIMLLFFAMMLGLIEIVNAMTSSSVGSLGSRKAQP
jgi:hypothetical protein